MKTANVADLRNNFRLVAAWISDGETVAIKRRGKPFATLVPSGELGDCLMPRIDFAAQMREVWGTRMFSDQEIKEMKRAEIEGEEG